MSTTPVSNMNHLYAHLKTLMPERRPKRGREDDTTEERPTKPRTQAVLAEGSTAYRTNGKTQTPAPNQTT